MSEQILTSGAYRGHAAARDKQAVTGKTPAVADETEPAEGDLAGAPALVAPART